MCSLTHSDGPRVTSGQISAAHHLDQNQADLERHGWSDPQVLGQPSFLLDVAEREVLL